MMIHYLHRNTSEHSSVVEHHVANVMVVGSSPIARSIFLYRSPASSLCCVLESRCNCSMLVIIPDISAAKLLKAAKQNMLYPFSCCSGWRGKTTGRNLKRVSTRRRSSRKLTDSYFPCQSGKNPASFSMMSN